MSKVLLGRRVLTVVEHLASLVIDQSTMHANLKDQGPTSLVCQYISTARRKVTSWLIAGKEKKNVWPNSLAVLHHVQPTSGSGNVPLSPERQFNLFVSKGTVSLSRDGEQVPIT